MKNIIISVHVRSWNGKDYRGESGDARVRFIGSL